MLRRLRLICAACVAAAIAAPAGAEANSNRAKGETLYAVMAHPDDEFAGWAIVEERTETYTIFVTMTQGDMTRSCAAPDEWGPSPGGPPDPLPHSMDLGWKGPHRYQGPDSPVGQPDLGEIHPLGNPWQGRGTEACADARLHSWNEFLDAMARRDPTLTAGPPYQGEFCEPEGTCAKVWADTRGARVAFNFGDGTLTPAEVTSGLQLLRAHRADWGIRVLPERQAASVAYYNTDDVCGGVYDHADHRAVQDALYLYAQGIPEQVGITCPTDPRLREQSPHVEVMNPATVVFALEIDPVTGRRIGPYVTYYGWLWDTYSWGAGDIGTSYFWRRDGASGAEKRRSDRPPESQPHRKERCRKKKRARESKRKRCRRA